MGYETYTGLVAREVDTGDADRYLTVLTAERGKLECYAKGIRKQKSSMASHAGLMSYAEINVYRNKDRYILTSAKSIEKFYDIRTDVVKCAYAMHFLEIARDVIVEAQAFPQALQTLLNALHVLCYRDLPPDFISRVFEIRILAISGFAPAVGGCSACGAPSLPGSSFFDVYGDGLVCAECKARAAKAAPISQGAIRAIRHVVECDAGAIFQFEISDRIKAELTFFIPAYLRHHFGRDYDKLDEAERYRAFELDIQNSRKERRRHEP